MNFFSHAALARAESDAPPFVLGAMLPDFAGMIRARPPSSEHLEIRAGIAFHHRTDDAFHACGAFRALCGTAFTELQRAGVARGSARAVAHIGIELLLDGVLAEERAARRAYETAVAAGADTALGGFVIWETAEQRSRFAHLCGVLVERGALAHDTRTELVVTRLVRALSGRPRLELDGSAEPHVRDWIERAREQVRREAPAMLRDVRAALGLAD